MIGNRARSTRYARGGQKTTKRRLQTRRNPRPANADAAALDHKRENNRHARTIARRSKTNNARGNSTPERTAPADPNARQGRPPGRRDDRRRAARRDTTTTRDRRARRDRSATDAAPAGAAGRRRSPVPDVEPAGDVPDPLVADVQVADGGPDRVAGVVERPDPGRGARDGAGRGPGNSGRKASEATSTPRASRLNEYDGSHSMDIRKGAASATGAAFRARSAGRRCLRSAGRRRSRRARRRPSVGRAAAAPPRTAGGRPRRAASRRWPTRR